MWVIPATLSLRLAYAQLCIKPLTDQQAKTIHTLTHEVLGYINTKHFVAKCPARSVTPVWVSYHPATPASRILYVTIHTVGEVTTNANPILKCTP